VIGVVVLIGGLWNAAAPWIFGYSDVHSAVASDHGYGPGLALVAVASVAIGGSWSLIGLASAIGVWFWWVRNGPATRAALDDA